MPFKPHQSTFDEKLSAIIGLVIGLVFIAVGFWTRNKIAYEQATLTETQGTVVSSVSRRERINNKETETYAPVIKFLSNGDRISFTGSYQSYRPSNGNVVVVRYDPEHPATTASVVEPFENLAPWVAFGWGGLSAVSSLGALLPVRWSSNKQP